MPKVQVNDISMYYESHGHGEPMVFIPGFSADSSLWQGIIDYFQKDYQVILFDNRGSGQTDIPEGPYSIKQMASDVAGLCNALNIDRAHFVGSSMGGYILQTLAHEHAKLVKSAVICNSTYATHTAFHIYVAAQLELMKANAPVETIIKASCAWAFSYRFLSEEGALDKLLDFGLSNPNPFTIKGYEGQYAALDAFDSRAWLKEINVPTLVIGSDEDLIFNEKSIKYLAENIPNATYSSFAECGHLPFLEFPDNFAEVVKRFLISKDLKD